MQERPTPRERLRNVAKVALIGGLIGLTSGALASFGVLPIDPNTACIPSGLMAGAGTVGLLLNTEPKFNYKDLRRNIPPGSDDSYLY